MKGTSGFISIIAAMLAMLSSLLLASILLTLTVSIKRQQNMLVNNKRFNACGYFIAQQEQPTGFNISTSKHITEELQLQEVELYDHGEAVFRMWRATF